jgi:hypothetical protein
MGKYISLISSVTNASLIDLSTVMTLSHMYIGDVMSDMHSTTAGTKLCFANITRL